MIRYNAAQDGLEMNKSLRPLEVGAGSTRLPDSFSTRSGPMYDQNKMSHTRYACTVFGSTHAAHSTRDSVYIDPYQTSKEAVSWGLNPTRGWSLQGVVGFFHETARISGYAKVEKTKEAVKQAIFSGYSIVTGSRNIDWGKTRVNDGRAVFGGESGHLFCIDGWDGDYAICRNSRDSLPEFYVHFKDLNKLYTLIAFLDVDTARVTKEQQDAKDIQHAIDEGITNGEELDHKATREQLAIMLGRLDDTTLTDAQLVEKTREQGIWNGAHGYALRRHSWIMIARWVLGKHSIGVPDYKLIDIIVKSGISNGLEGESIATRKQIIIMVVRAQKAKKGLFV